MRITELVLEGFKSYPVRTRIDGWDSSFNAITGLNGSGKSNILDAICFALGINNMQQMRAQNLQDLIYKRGQAGVTKASVTIVFDNSEKDKSPQGLEGMKEITVTRQITLPIATKYLINGRKAKQEQVLTLFQSVQLNINNPNFVIMQGRITKVLNMRPQEILGMIEEAAGTRMFEERKEKARKTIAKKERKVHDIRTLLDDEITPKLDKLRKDKKSYHEYERGKKRLDELLKTVTAHDWWEHRKKEEEKRGEVVERKRAVEQKKGQQRRLEKEIETLEERLHQLTAERAKEMKKGGKLTALESEVSELSKELARLETQLDMQMANIAEQEKKLADTEKQTLQLEATFKEKEAAKAKLQENYDAIKKKGEDFQAKIDENENLLSTLLTGLSNSSTKNAAGGYLGQIAAAQKRLTDASAEEKQLKTKLSMKEGELGQLQGRWKQVEREVSGGQQKAEALRAEVQGLEEQVESCGWNAEKDQQAQADMRETQSRVRELGMRRDEASNSLGNYSFDCPPGFDARQVKGTVASLVRLSQENYPKATALELAASTSRLANVVVRDQQVSKEIIEKANLRQRTSFIPLNKIQPQTLSGDKKSRAMHLAKGRGAAAIDLITYPHDVEKAMQFVFGSTFICEDAEAAKEVTYKANVRTVTLQGDIYEPSGSLTGGSAPAGAGVLTRMQKLIEVADALDEARKRLASLQREEQKSAKVREQWAALARQLDMKRHELQLAEAQMKGSNAAQIGQQIEDLKKEIEELKAAIQDAKQRQKEAAAEVEKFKRDEEEYKNNKDGKIDELRVKREGQAEAERVAGCDGRERHQAKEAELDAEKATLKGFDDGIKNVEREIKDCKLAAENLDEQLKDLEREVASVEKEAAALGRYADKLEDKFAWIKKEKGTFGEAGGPYDFSNVGEVVKETRAIEEQLKTKTKKIAQKDLMLLDTVEKREAESLKKIESIIEDKAKIEHTIEELDKEKRDALRKTWEKVDKDFGGIFGELLPGNFAKLVPPENMDYTTGLEVKVQLGSVWKQSLTELSGGQRSLIALSLIMALLQFKPAPMYILDEIDAALDLQHTQHIGQLFRTRFKGSQFIVVSLKEGLFTNANVLFKARFRDGTSIVERTAQRSTSGGH
ncbi:RecF/RecN/SMC [Schizophyllum fasciatum]